MEQFLKLTFYSPFFQIIFSRAKVKISTWLVNVQTLDSLSEIGHTAQSGVARGAVDPWKNSLTHSILIFFHSSSLLVLIE